MTKLEDLKPLFYKLKMKAMYEQAESMLENIETARMTHTEWIKELLEAEIVRRESNALNRRIKVAGIRYLDACMSGIDFDIDRGLDQTQILELGTCDWIRKHQNVIITGKTGCGGRGMQKRNFDSELKSLNDRPSNQASICKATSSPKLNGVF